MPRQGHVRTRPVMAISSCFAALLLLGCGGRADRVSALDVTCNSSPGGNVAGQAGEIAPGTDLVEVSLQLDDDEWVATWQLAGSSDGVADPEERSGWSVGLLAPDEESAYFIEVTQDGSGLRGRVVGGGPSGERAGEGPLTITADGDVITARVPKALMDEVEVDWLWTAMSFSGDALAGGRHTDSCFDDLDPSRRSFTESGTVEPAP